MFDLGRELYDRIGVLGRHMDGLGGALTKSVAAYNQAVGSLENRVLVSARRLNQLGVVDAELEPPRPVEETTRALSAPELVTGAGQDGPELAAGPPTGPPVPPTRLAAAPTEQLPELYWRAAGS